MGRKLAFSHAPVKPSEIRVSGVMAGRSCFSGSLIIYVLLNQISINFFMYNFELPTREKLHVLSVSQDLNRVKFVSRTTYVKASSKEISNMATSKLKIAMKLLNITLAANLVILANDVSQNPGPACPPLPSEIKGLRVFHLN